MRILLALGFSLLFAASASACPYMSGDSAGEEVKKPEVVSS